MYNVGPFFIHIYLSRQGVLFPDIDKVKQH